MDAFMKRSLLTLVTMILMSGCGDDPAKPDPSAYLDASSPENVLENLQTAYKLRESMPYADLLADDFRFYFDEGTRQQNGSLPEYWERSEDAAQTGALFASDQVTDIRVDLRHGAAEPVTVAGRESWLRIRVTDTFLEVDLKPQPGELEGLTLRVDGQQNDFYFRKGKSAADTLSGSATAQFYHLVEWRDFGVGRSAAPDVLIESTTWGRIKALYRKGEPLAENTTWSTIKGVYSRSPATEPGTWGRIKALIARGDIPAVQRVTWGGIKAQVL